MSEREVSFRIGASDQTGPGIRSALGRLNDLETSGARAVQGLQRAFAGVAAGVVLKEIAQAIGSITQAADDLADAAQRVDVTVESLQTLRLVAGEFGGSAETADKALQKLQESLGSAVTKGGAASAAFRRLGLDAGSLAASGADTALFEVADAIAAVDNQAQQAALATEIFGRSGRELLPMLQAGAPAIREQAAAYEAMGLVLSNELVGTLANANRAFELAGTAVKNLGAQFVGGLAPFITQATQAITSAVGEIGGLEAIGGKVGATLSVAFQIIRNTVLSLQAAFFGLAAAGARVLQALTFGDVSRAFAASVDENLLKAQGALDQVRSIEQIQAGIVATLERARVAATAPQTAAPGPVQPPAAPGAPGAPGAAPATPEASLAALDTLIDLETQAAIQRVDLDRTMWEGRIAAASEASEFLLALTGERVNQEIAFEEMKAQGLGASLGTALGLLAQHNTKVAKAQQALRIAETVWTTAKNIAEQFPNPAGMAAAAAIGALQLAKIKSTMYSPSGTTGGGGFAAGGSDSPSLATSRTDLFGRDGAPSPFEQRAIRVEVVGKIDDGAGRTIADLLAKEVKDRDVVFIEPGTRQARELAPVPA